MTRDKRRGDDETLFGAPGARREWELQRDDERTREAEKTQRLREARLAAQSVSAPTRAAAKASVKGVGSTLASGIAARRPLRNGPAVRNQAPHSGSRS